jgi:hypothetical protein
MVRRKSKTVESFFFIIVLYKSYRITTPGSQINQLVHELYELMEEEIKIVERMLRETKETPTYLPLERGGERGILTRTPHGTIISSSHTIYNLLFFRNQPIFFIQSY